jgi:predicted RNase H-like nuclease (RuvC/YqgF family)
MEDKKKIKLKIQETESIIYRTQADLENKKIELDKLKKDYKKLGPRYFIISESKEEPISIVGRWNPFTVIELDRKPDKNELSGEYIIVKEMTSDDFI